MRSVRVTLLASLTRPPLSTTAAPRSATQTCTASLQRNMCVALASTLMLPDTWILLLAGLHLLHTFNHSSNYPLSCTFVASFIRPSGLKLKLGVPTGQVNEYWTLYKARRTCWLHSNFHASVSSLFVIMMRYLWVMSNCRGVAPQGLMR